MVLVEHLTIAVFEAYCWVYRSNNSENRSTFDEDLKFEVKKFGGWLFFYPVHKPKPSILLNLDIYPNILRSWLQYPQQTAGFAAPLCCSWPLSSLIINTSSRAGYPWLGHYLTTATDPLTRQSDVRPRETRDNIAKLFPGHLTVERTVAWPEIFNRRGWKMKWRRHRDRKPKAGESRRQRRRWGWMWEEVWGASGFFLYQNGKFSAFRVEFLSFI